MSSFRSGPNGSASDPAGRRAGSRSGAGLDQKSRAELFEDEKRRIIESCFAKKEPDGACEIPPTAVPAMVRQRSEQATNRCA
jgi:hypothetical protein